MSPLASPTAPRRDGLALAALALLVFALLGQETYYKLDGWVTQVMFVRGEGPHPNHVFFLGALRGFAWLVAPLSLTPYELMRLFGAVGVALAVFVVHRSAAALGLPRARAALAAAAVAAAPGPLFFATVTEFHGAFLGCAALCFYAAVRTALRPTATRAMLVGLLGADAYGMHASGILLGAVAGPFLFVFARERGVAARRAFAIAGLAVAAELALCWALPAGARAAGLLPAAADRSAAFAAGHTREIAERLGALPGADYFLEQFTWGELARPGLVAATLWNEFVFALLPVSLLAFLARGASRAALACALLPYLGAAFVLLRGVSEHGGYLLPLVLPAAILAARSCSQRVLAAALALGFALGLAQVVRHDDFAFGPRFAERVHAVSEGRGGLLVVAEDGELRASLMHLPELEIRHVEEFPVDRAEPAELEHLLAQIRADLARRRARREVFVLSPAALRWLDEPGHAARARLRAALAGRYRVPR